MTYADVTGPRKSPLSRSQIFKALPKLPIPVSGEEILSWSHRHGLVSPSPCDRGEGWGPRRWDDRVEASSASY